GRRRRWTLRGRSIQSRAYASPKPHGFPCPGRRRALESVRSLALVKSRGLGHNSTVARRPSVISALAGCALLTGCLGFGGPLVDDGEQDAESGTDETDGEQRCGPSTAVVEYVIDGDTVVLSSGEHVRYLLIDTPETAEGKDECWGPEATEHNAAMVANRAVSLTYDVECEDQYGRLLAYVAV